MSGLVVDASIALEVLLRTPLGLSVEDDLLSSSLIAPEMLDAEVLSSVRKATLRGQLTPEDAEGVLVTLGEWDIERISHRTLVPLAWQYRHNLSAYDALYVAVSRLYDYPLITSDGRLSRASGLDIDVQHALLS